MKSRRAVFAMIAGAFAMLSRAQRTQSLFKSTFERNRFVNQTIDLDDQTFVACIFQDCRLRYGGGALQFSYNTLLGSKLLLVGAAERTASLLQAFGGKIPIELAVGDKRSPEI